MIRVQTADGIWSNVVDTARVPGGSAHLDVEAFVTAIAGGAAFFEVERPNGREWVNTAHVVRVIAGP